MESVLLTPEAKKKSVISLKPLSVCLSVAMWHRSSKTFGPISMLAFRVSECKLFDFFKRVYYFCTESFNTCKYISKTKSLRLLYLPQMTPKIAVTLI